MIILAYSLKGKKIAKQYSNILMLKLAILFLPSKAMNLNIYDIGDLKNEY
jgi:hypothetical protein